MGMKWLKVIYKCKEKIKKCKLLDLRAILSISQWDMERLTIQEIKFPEALYFYTSVNVCFTIYQKDDYIHEILNLH